MLHLPYRLQTIILAWCRLVMTKSAESTGRAESTGSTDIGSMTDHLPAGANIAIARGDGSAAAASW